MHAQKHTHAKCGERKWTEGKQRNIPLDSQCSKLLTKTQMQNKNKCVQMRDFRGTQCHLSDSFTTNKREIECRLMKTDMAQGTNDYRSYCTLPWGKIKKSFMSHTVLKGGQIIVSNPTPVLLTVQSVLHIYQELAPRVSWNLREPASYLWCSCRYPCPHLLTSVSEQQRDIWRWAMPACERSDSSRSPCVQYPLSWLETSIACYDSHVH